MTTVVAGQPPPTGLSPVGTSTSLAAAQVTYYTKLAIRRSALLLLGEQPVVFVETGTTPQGQLRFERRPVAVDEMEGGDYVPIKTGVTRGEQVVVSGGVLLLGML
jgi:hypothetical protein